MVHVIFDTSKVRYDDFFHQQDGSGLSNELSSSDDIYPSYYYKGSAPYQRGYGGLQRGAGIGNVFRALWRRLRPIARRVGLAVASEALNTGQRVISKVATEGAPLGQSLLAEGKRGIDNVLEEGGLPRQFGTGGTIKGRRRSQNSSLNNTKTKKPRRRINSKTFLNKKFDLAKYGIIR
jgi:hypothetical protein